MPTMKVDFSEVNDRTSIRDFPDGPVEATINNATLDVSKTSAAPMIRLEFTVYHPDHGEATLKDTLPSLFPAKVQAFWQAFNRLSKEELKNESAADIDPADLVGASLIVVLGESTNEKTGKTYKQVDYPWYYADDRVDVLEYEDTPF